MKQRDRTTASSGSPETTDGSDKKIPKNLAPDAPSTVNDSSRKIDRPGFDLGGSSGDTDAGTGLGLGDDAFDTPDERSLPVRRPDNKLTIPRWGGPEPRTTDESPKKQPVLKAPSASQPKGGS